MGKQVINQIECGQCHQMFDVATEDIEWKHLKDAGEVENNKPKHDFYVVQKVRCPHCGKMNIIIMHALGVSSSNLASMKVISL